MKSNFIVFNRIHNNIIILMVILLTFSKIVVYVSFNNNFFNLGIGAGGNDADYYNSYAEGLTNVAVNIWPTILRYLNDFNLYSRESVSYFLFFLNLFVIPSITCNLAGLAFKKYQKYYLYCFLIVSLYPTIFFYSLDIYRDVFMVFIFLLACMVIKKYLASANFLSAIFYFIVSILLGFFLIGLRPYLGYAFLLSFLLWRIKFTKRRVILFGALYLSLLFIANYVGALEFLTEYRSGFEEGSGSNLGLDFSNPALFIPNFILSFLGQMLGLYITNPLAVVLFILETTPFFFMLVYIIKNIKLADSFVRFLIMFFVIYGSVWLIGNDNLGTAVRLRLYNYLAIYISFFCVMRLKSLAPNKLQVIHK